MQTWRKKASIFLVVDAFIITNVFNLVFLNFVYIRDNK